MRNLHRALQITPFIIFFFFLNIGSIWAEESSLADQLVQKLGVTKEQAQGGAGAIFKVAKDKLTADDFGKVAEAVPRDGPNA